MMRLRLFLIALVVSISLGAEAKTLVFCSEGNPETVNPQVASTAMGTNAARPMFDNLVQFKPGTADIIPGLAKSWDISPDGTEYVFHLRENVPFHTRERFTPTRFLNADDVVFSFARQWQESHPFHKPAEGSYDYFQDLGLAGLLVSIDKLDEHTVRFKLARAEAPFITDLAMPFAMILSAEYAEAMRKAGTPDRLDHEPIGTGPFIFEGYQKDVSLRYSAFPDYWNGRPPIDTLVMSITSNVAARMAKLRAGECQVMALPGLGDVARIEGDDRLSLLRQDGLNIAYLAMNASKTPFNNVRVRKAVALAIDRKTLVRAVYGSSGTPIKNPLPPALWSYNDAIQDYDYDVGAAQQLMIDAGFGGGFDTELWYMPISRPYNPDSRRMAEMMADDLARIGIRAKLLTASWSDYRAKLMAGDAPLSLYGWIGDNGDPDNFLAIILGCHDGQPGPGNIAKWCNAEYDSLMAQGKLIADRTTRDTLYRQAQIIAHDQVPLLPIAQSSVFMAVRKNVHGFNIDPLGRYLFDRVDLDTE